MKEIASIARVGSVRTNGGRVWVDTEPGFAGRDFPEIPFGTSSAGQMITPAEGDLVEVYKTDDGYHAQHVHSYPEYTMPDLPEDSFVHKFNDGTEISAIKNGDDTYDVTLKADNNVTINVSSGSSVDIGQGGQGAITDIETSTDADGHITDITLVRSNKVHIE